MRPRVAVAVGAAFFALGLAGVLRHEMWRDELEIWLVAVGSAGPLELLANMRTEGHPVLWYLLNFVLTRFTRDPVAMQLLNLIVGTSAAVLFFRRAPFSLPQRLAFCFGYYLLYEFTVISRAYALALLLAFAFCARFAERRRLDLAGAALLFLLANTTLYGTIIAAHVVLLSAAQVFFERRPRQLLRGLVSLPLLVGLGGVAVGLGHTWIQTAAMGQAHLGAYAPRHDATWVADCLATTFYGAVPLPDPASPHSWNSHVLQLLPAPWPAWVGGALGVTGLVLALLALRRRPVLAAVFALGTAAMLSIVFFIWFGWMRHHGQVFLWFVVCCWLAEGLAADGPSPPAPRSALGPRPVVRGGWVLTALLGTQVVAGAHAWAVDLARPFSNARAVGTLLRQPEFAETRLVGSVDYTIQPVAAYADRAFYYPESGRVGTFLDWGPGRRHVTLAEVLEDVSQLLRRERRDVVLVLNYRPGPLDPGERMLFAEGAWLSCFARFVGAVVPDENYHLCHAFLEPPEAQAKPLTSSGADADNGNVSPLD